MQTENENPAADATASGANGSDDQAGELIENKNTPASGDRPVPDAALALAAERGWYVFPAEFAGEAGEIKKSHKSAGHSNGRNWGATNDVAQVKRDFRRWPDAGIGIPTGPDNGIFVVETDTKEGHAVDGIASLKQLEAERGQLPVTLMAESPSGSRHYYFNWPPKIVITNSTSKIAPGVDVRGDGGMVIAPPSVRPGKGAYRWLNDHPIADAPQWLIDLVTADQKPKYEPLPDWLLDLAKGDVGKGISRDADDRPPPVDQRKIKVALAAINPDIKRSLWFEIGCSLFDELGQGSGFALWNEWSSKGEKYKESEMLAQWGSIVAKDGYGYTIASLFWIADEADPSWRSRYEREGAGAAEALKAGSLIQSSKEFVGGFVPPFYLIDGLLQQQFVYSVTGMTGHGKTTVMLRIAAHVACGLPLDKREVEKARVLFFAGENPDDIRMRWIKLCEEMKCDASSMDVFFLPGTPPISNAEIRKRIDAEAARHGLFGLLIVDTSAAYFPGDDENSNAQLGAHARMLRTFVNLPGGPTVMVTTHPPKNPNMDNLLPRGGGAFLNEMDGNLVCINNDGVVTIHWHGKFRGPDFAPIPFKLNYGTTDKLKDAKGRLIWTVTASPISEADKATLEDTGRRRQDQLLILLSGNTRLSLAEMAEKLDWRTSKGEPNRTLVNRTLANLIKDKLVERQRGQIVLTKAGEKVVKDADTM